MKEKNKIVSMNQNQIKYLVIVAMLIDHIAWAFVPTASVLGQIMHFIGRLTGPTMAYFIVEGYQHTRNVKKYALRLGIFALISWAPYVLFEGGKLPIVIDEHGVNIQPYFGVIYTLFLSLLAVWLWDKGECRHWQKIVCIVGLCLLSILGDWPIFDILYAVFFFIYREEPKRKWTAYSIISAAEVVLLMSLNIICNINPLEQFFQIGVFMVPLLIELCYNGERGSKRPVHKWFFYIFYPAHLLILALIKMLCL